MRNAQVQNAANELIRNIDEEVADEKRKNSRFDADLLTSRKQDLLKAANDAVAGLKKPEQRQEAEAHVIAVQHGIARVEAVQAKAPTAVHGQRRYSNACREAARRTHALLTDIRTRFAKRLGTSVLAKGIKVDLGVGTPVSSDAPPEVKRWGIRQIAALEAADNQALFRKRGLKPALALEELRPAVQNLSKELDEGVGPAPKQGEVSSELVQSLVWLEVAVERTVTLLQDFKAGEAAGKVEGLVPMRPGVGRRASDREEDEREEEGGNGGGTPGEGGPVT